MTYSYISRNICCIAGHYIQINLECLGRVCQVLLLLVLDNGINSVLCIVFQMIKTQIHRIFKIFVELQFIRSIYNFF